MLRLLGINRGKGVDDGDFFRFWSCSKNIFQWIFSDNLCWCSSLFAQLTHSIPQHLCKCKHFRALFFRWCTFNLFEFLYCQFENLEYLKQRHFNMFHISTETNWFLSISVCFSNQLLPSFIIFVLFFFSIFCQSFSFTFQQLAIFRSLFANVFHSNFSIEMCCFLLSIKHLIFRFIEFICILYDIWLLREIPRIV